MYERILMAIDGSGTSDQALDEAIRLAQFHKAKLRLLHVIDTVMLDMDNGGLLTMPDLLDAWRQSGKNLLKKSQTHAEQAGITTETALLETLGVTRVATEIVADAKNWSADLIVLGTHGRRGFSHLLLGSVAEDAVRMATMPVLLIRENKQ